jgi:hypothetical protein
MQGLFWRDADHIALVQHSRYTGHEGTRQQTRTRQDFHAFAAVVQRRETCSQRRTIPEAAYHAGVRQIRAEVGQGARAAPPRPGS